jgi:mRNA interferase RelE/StbE
VSSWRLEVAPACEHTLARLPTRVAPAIVEFLVGLLLDAPERVGKPLQRELDGYQVARRGAYGIIYRVLQDQRVVRVLRIEHRADVYRQR